MYIYIYACIYIYCILRNLQYHEESVCEWYSFLSTILEDFKMCVCIYIYIYIYTHTHVYVDVPKNFIIEM